MSGCKDDQPQCAVVGHVAVRREDVNAIEERRAARHLLQHFGDLAAHIVLVVEAPLPVLHFAAEVGAGIKPEAGRVLGLVSGAVQVVQAICQSVQRVGVGRRRLARLQATEQHPGTIETSDPAFVATDDGALPRKRVRATRRAAFTCAETRLFVLQFGCLSTVAINVLFDDRVPACWQIVGQLVARTAVVKRQASGQNHQVLVVILPKSIDDLGHQLEHAASALESVNGRPVFIEPIEHLGMDRIGLHQSVVSTAPPGFRRELGSFGHIGIGKGATDRLTSLLVTHRLEQSPPHDLERFFRGDGLPKRLHATESLFKCPKCGHAALAAASTSDSGNEARTMALGTSFTLR